MSFLSHFPPSACQIATGGCSRFHEVPRADAKPRLQSVPTLPATTPAEGSRVSVLAAAREAMQVAASFPVPGPFRRLQAASRAYQASLRDGRETGGQWPEQANRQERQAANLFPVPQEHRLTKRPGVAFSALDETSCGVGRRRAFRNFTAAAGKASGINGRAGRFESLLGVATPRRAPSRAGVGRKLMSVLLPALGFRPSRMKLPLNREQRIFWSIQMALAASAVGIFLAIGLSDAELMVAA